MLYALIGTLVIGIGFAPLGLVLVLRKITLVAEVISHGMLPGIALGFILGGGATLYVLLGAMVCGMLLAGTASALGARKDQSEEASYQVLHLLAVALGVMMISVYSSTPILHNILFGQLLGVDTYQLLLIALVSAITVILMLLFSKRLLITLFDSNFYSKSEVWYWVFAVGPMILLALNLTTAFRAVGVFLAVGIMTMPVLAARYWVISFWSTLFLAVIFSVGAGYAGLLFSWHLDVPPSLMIIIVLGVIWCTSLGFGNHNGIFRLGRKKIHLTG